jgi:hypothetical protein
MSNFQKSRLKRTLKYLFELVCVSTTVIIVMTAGLLLVIYFGAYKV